jgi:hypothetical protein
MPESVVREELEALCPGSDAASLCAPWSGHLQRSTPDPAFYCVGGMRTGLQKVRSLSELYGLRVSVETCVAPKDPFQCRLCQRFGHSQRNCRYAPRYVACGEAHLSGEWASQRQQLKCCSCGGNHTAATGAAASGKKRKRRLRSRCPPNAPGPAVPLVSPPHIKCSGHSHQQGRRSLGLDGTTLSEEVVLWRLPPILS